MHEQIEKAKIHTFYLSLFLFTSNLDLSPHTDGQIATLAKLFAQPLFDDVL